MADPSRYWLERDGQVIGINTLKFVGDFDSPVEGIGLAISSDDVTANLDALMNGRIVRLPWQTYQSRVYDYSIDYPPSWVLDDDVIDFVVIDQGNYATVIVDIFDLSAITSSRDPLETLVEFILDFRREDAENSGYSFDLTSSREVGRRGDEYQWITTWLEEMQGRTEFFEQFGDRLPDAIREEHEAQLKRLG